MTFGSFNNPAMITPEVVATWSEVLRRVPTARLMLLYRGLDDEGVRRHFLERFGAHGIDPGRLEVVGGAPRNDPLEAYRHVDVALDPFPYSGGLTTCEALWMGVPVVTCPGATFASRHSYSHLSNAGLPETIARDLPDYVDRAVGLAADPTRLAALRAELRDRVARSPLCDGDRFTRNLTAALGALWRERRQAVATAP